MKINADCHKNDTVRDHIPALDGLRGFAILLVIFIHFGAGVDLPVFFHRLAYMGWTGVDLFFVLSGFLITRILLTSKNSRHYFKNFYLRRMLRIFPLYYAALVCGIWLIPAILPETIVQPYLGQSQSHQGWLWSYSVNIARTFMPIVSFGMFSHFWSLAIEEQFYIIWPSVVKWLEPKRLFYVCLSIIAVSLFGRIVCCSMTPDWGVAYMLTNFSS